MHARPVESGALRHNAGDCGARLVPMVELKSTRTDDAPPTASTLTLMSPEMARMRSDVLGTRSCSASITMEAKLVKMKAYSACRYQTGNRARRPWRERGRP
jgi:hypothetical protein